ncbi:MAG: Clp protease N-terminal domain-containing protein [Candidatus Asgardarchaeia archaeon]
MFERFTDRARKVMKLANEAAHTFNSDYIGTIHVLYGLLKEGSGVGHTALNHSEELKITRDQLLVLVHAILEDKEGESSSSVGEKLPQTETSKKVIEYAIEEARSLSHNYVGSEHILLGLLHSQKTKEGAESEAYYHLSGQGLTLAGVKGEVMKILGVTVSDTTKASIKQLAQKGTYLQRSCKRCTNLTLCVVYHGLMRVHIPEGTLFRNKWELLDSLYCKTAVLCSKYDPCNSSLVKGS